MSLPKKALTKNILPTNRKLKKSPTKNLNRAAHHRDTSLVSQTKNALLKNFDTEPKK